MRVALLLGALLGACATIGPPFPTDRVDELAVGTTTREQVLAWFGEPHQKSKPLPHEKCSERWHWSSEPRVPDETGSRVLVLEFDETGVLCGRFYDEVHHRPATQG